MCYVNNENVNLLHMYCCVLICSWLSHYSTHPLPVYNPADQKLNLVMFLMYKSYNDSSKCYYVHIKSLQ